jgi:hypothetical protein
LTRVSAQPEYLPPTMSGCAIEVMNKRIGRWRGEVDESTGLKALGTIGSAPATFMMSRALALAVLRPHHRTNTRLQPISACRSESDRRILPWEKTGPPAAPPLQEESIYGFTASPGKDLF